MRASSIWAKEATTVKEIETNFDQIIHNTWLLSLLGTSWYSSHTHAKKKKKVFQFNLNHLDVSEFVLY